MINKVLERGKMKKGVMNVLKKRFTAIKGPIKLAILFNAIKVGNVTLGSSLNMKCHEKYRQLHLQR